MAIRDQWHGWKLKEQNITNAAVIVLYINIESTRVIYCYLPKQAGPAPTPEAVATLPQIFTMVRSRIEWIGFTS